jgi:hypothetical protein
VPPSPKPEVVVLLKVVMGDVVVDIVFVVGVYMHSLLKSIRVPGTVQLNLAACSTSRETREINVAGFIHKFNLKLILTICDIGYSPDFKEQASTLW